MARPECVRQCGRREWWAGHSAKCLYFCSCVDGPNVPVLVCSLFPRDCFVKAREAFGCVFKGVLLLLLLKNTC